MTNRRGRLAAIGPLAALLVGLLGGTGHAGAQSLGALTLTEVSPRIVTPNDDGFNDVIYFKFGTTVISGLPIEAGILDINGARISNLTLSTSETALIWNGKTDSGQVAPTGGYIYFIRIGKNLATGTIVVAK